MLQFVRPTNWGSSGLILPLGIIWHAAYSYRASTDFWKKSVPLFWLTVHPLCPFHTQSPTCLALEGILFLWPWWEISLKLCSPLFCDLAHVKFIHVHTHIPYSDGLSKLWAVAQKIGAESNASSCPLTADCYMLPIKSHCQEAQNLSNRTWSPESLQINVIYFQASAFHQKLLEGHLYVFLETAVKF